MNPDNNPTAPSHKTNQGTDIKYRQDPDLEFLKGCTGNSLNTLGCVLQQSKPSQHGQRQVAAMSARDYVQITCKQSSSPAQDTDPALYKGAPLPQPPCWEVFAGQIQRLGANPLALVARRGLGAHYIKILENICDLFSVKYIPDSSAEVMERELCLALFSRSLQSLKEEHLPVLCNAFALLPDNLSINAFTPKLIDAMRLNDEPKYLLTMCVGHGAAVHIGCAGYESFAPEKYHAILELLEKPLKAELNTIPSVSRTGLQYWLLVPAVLQIPYLRATQNTQQM